MFETEALLCLDSLTASLHMGVLLCFGVVVVVVVGQLRWRTKENAATAVQSVQVECTKPC
jgi:hypothetical protein